MRTLKILTIALVVVLVPALVASAADVRNQVSFGQSNMTAAKINPHSDARTVSVPLQIGNTMELVAVDLPLRFGNPGDGINLVDVDFASGRANYFDETIANVDNDEKTVILGMISMVYKEKQDLQVGSGLVANLTFEITDPTLKSFTIDATTMENPHHKVMYVYNEYTEIGPEVNWVEPEFSGVTVDLGDATVARTTPTTFSLDQNYPNPFNAGTVINFAMPVGGEVSLDVYNVLGQKVVNLSEGFHEPGNYNVQWDGSDHSGNKVASGMYFYRLITPSYVQTRKMTLLK